MDSKLEIQMNVLSLCFVGMKLDKTFTSDAQPPAYIHY